MEYIENFQYALWIETHQYDDEDTNENPILDLYGFSDFESLQEFIQGLLTIVHAFNISYEECIVHCPVLLTEMVIHMPLKDIYYQSCVHQ